ncbi:U3 small nucleolar RNA-associated protein 14 homolog A [Orussus abietinus]|uniref:U3 small nucleolar RNA-associated protein 14 homolog A n=1 Tax=Orussus abietinus TaxID=222816 RepID=UPI0006269BA1|nr:U3 small nucleolar RNA-associated protein 14 homolog A [Orussus abietinus]
MSDDEMERAINQEVSTTHDKLLKPALKLNDKQRVKQPVRSEPSLEVSEFHLVRSGVPRRHRIHVQSLANSLVRKGRNIELTKKLKATQSKAHLLYKPLEKPAAERIKRKLGFDNVKEELQKWNAIIARNRTAERMTFPLSQPSMGLGGTTYFFNRFRIQSELEKELAELEPKKPEIEVKDDQFSATLQEILERRNEAAKLRAQQSYREAKAFRQNKIKSKKFHRVQRKEKIKKQIKEFEELQKIDPGAALEKLEQLDRTRAEERMSLRHKSTGQWAKSKQVRAKYDKESRQALAEQLAVSRDLTQKIRKDEDSEDEGEEEEELSIPVSAMDKDNPWMTNGTKTKSEIDDFISGYRRYWDGKKKEEEEKQNQEESDKNKTNDKPGKKSNTEKAKKEAVTLNPVEEVIIENKNHGKPVKKKGVNKKSSCSSSKKVSEQKKKTAESAKNSAETKSKRKLNGVISKRAVRASPGTSSWSVTPMKSYVKNNLLPRNSMINDVENKLQDKINDKLKKLKRKMDASDDVDEVEEKDGSEDEGYSGDLGFKKQRIRPVIDEQLDELPGRMKSRDSKEAAKPKAMANGDFSHAKAKTKEAEIDPNKFIKAKPVHMMSQLPDMITGGEDALDDSEEEEERYKIISEAFADDDVVDEFRKEKEEEVKKSQPEDVDLTLPGWGSWGGKDVAVSKRKKKQFIMKFPKDAPRRDENKGDVIIVEGAEEQVRQHQVNELPFPFGSVQDFEASIRAPLGRNFVPENAHKRLTHPAVKTKLGKIIEPMTEDVLVDKLKVKPKGRIPVVKRKGRWTPKGGISTTKKKGKWTPKGRISVTQKKGKWIPKRKGLPAKSMGRPKRWTAASRNGKPPGGKN